MVVRRSKPKKIRKVIENEVGALVAVTDKAVTLHTVTDPATTKRFIGRITTHSDGHAASDVVNVGMCITSPGETLPTIANVEAEENRWIWFDGMLTVANTVGPQVFDFDMKIQRKVKDGDVISLVIKQTDAGDYSAVVTLFLDET